MFFFKEAKVPLKDDREPHEEIIVKLTHIREKNYEILDIKTSEYTEIKNLVLNLGDRILKANSNTDEERSICQAHFNRTIESFFKTRSKFAVVSFSVQLLQYFTIISDPQFTSGTSYQEFVAFLNDNEEKFGDTNKNLFITEYKLIKAYNDVCVFTDAVAGKIAFIPDIDQEVNFLLGELSIIKTQVDQWTIDAPDNAFVYYLNFAVNYSCAKILELQYKMLITEPDSATEDQEAIFLNAAQKFFLIDAAKSLEQIDVLEAYYKELHPHLMALPGSEFSLGQNMITNKIPGADLPSLQMHLSSLISQ